MLIHEMTEKECHDALGQAHFGRLACQQSSIALKSSR